MPIRRPPLQKMLMNNKYFVGIDTSNYTTSFAICDYLGNIVLNYKKLLPVKQGERGLRQSDAVFHHTAAMTDISNCIRNFRKENVDAEICAVGFSKAPRDNEGSYMPCFLVGAGVANVLAATFGIPAYGFSHQSGHIMAALYSAECTDLKDMPFAAFHVSGGTTDILAVKGKSDPGFDIERLGGTLDLNAGQVIDRVGVYMGLSFPSGAILEKLALRNGNRVPKYRVCVKGLECNLSGIENKACKLYDETKDMNLVAAYTLNAVGDTLAALTENLIGAYSEMPVVYAGGVMSCSIFKERLGAYSDYFAKPEFSSDNAAGTVLLARERYLSENNMYN